MFIEKMLMTPLEFRRNGIEDKHTVPTKSTPNARLAFVGTKELEATRFL